MRERGKENKNTAAKKQKPEKSHSGSPRSRFGTGQDGEHLLLVQARGQLARGSGPRVSPWSRRSRHPLLSLNTWVPQLRTGDKNPNTGDSQTLEIAVLSLPATQHCVARSWVLWDVAARASTGPLGTLQMRPC